MANAVSSLNETTNLLYKITKCYESYFHFQNTLVLQSYLLLPSCSKTSSSSVEQTGRTAELVLSQHKQKNSDPPTVLLPVFTCENPSSFSLLSLLSCSSQVSDSLRPSLLHPADPHHHGSLLSHTLFCLLLFFSAFTNFQLCQ